ncbi:MAG TPA: amidase [Patescibacteria group bacterium]|nr:amidase [Patescibacteria group bacterium]
MSEDILALAVPEILSLYEKKKLSPVEVTQACLKQILKYNPVLNALSIMDERHALQQAKTAEKRWAKGGQKGGFDGIPVTVKDSFNVKGWPSRQGSLTTSPVAQRDDSPAVTLLRDAGGIIIGKTTMPEFGVKGVTDSPLTGVTRNPWNTRKTPGGSSGGAAVAAATGMAYINLGSDAGGSIRIPASFTGVFGFKPSPGLIPAYPPGLFSTLWSAGPITRNVTDAACVMDALVKNDPRDWHAVPFPAPQFCKQLQAPLPKLRIAVASSINGISAVPEVRDLFSQKIAQLKKLGSVDEIKIDAPGLIDVFNRHWMAVAAYSVSEFPLKQRKQLDPRFLHWAKRGEGLTLKEYLSAERERMDIGAYFKELLASYDLLITPSTPMTAFDTGINMPNDAKGKPWEDWTPFTYPANLAKLPSASLPMGLTKSGLPAGMMVTAGYLRDVMLMQACYRIEQELGFTPWLQAKKEG